MSSNENIPPIPELIESRIDVSHYSQDILLSLETIASFGGEIRHEDPTVAEPAPLFVADHMRGKGIGERLVRALIVETQKLGVDTIRGHLESEYALDIGAKVFGEEALKFFYDDPQGTSDNYPEQYSELPITFAQARQSLVRAGRFEGDLDHREIGFDVEVDISGIDMSSSD